MNNTFVKYKDLLTIKDYNKETDKEEFVLIPLEDELVFGRYQKSRNMLEYGQQIAIRKTVYNMLIEVAKKLKLSYPNYKLMVAFGYRDMKKKKKFFNDILEKVKDKFDDEMEMLEYIHEKIAVPEVSGHTTGGAVDVAIYDSQKNKMLDYGTDILDYNTNKCYYISDEITETERENRELLRNIMVNEGFAPYDGEWWHFSYGDKEWAFYYHKKEALYNQVDVERVFNKFNDKNFQD